MKWGKGTERYKLPVIKHHRDEKNSIGNVIDNNDEKNSIGNVIDTILIMLYGDR